MKECPACREYLREVRQYEILIDACPKCKGIWLDHGELGKIIQLVREETGPPKESYKEPYKHRDHDDRHRYDDDRYDDRYKDHSYYKHKKKSRLSEIFDIFD